MNGANSSVTFSSDDGFAAVEVTSPRRTTAAPFAAETSVATLDTKAVLTLVLWLGCVAVGLLGFALHYSRPVAPAPAPAPVTVEKINVELTQDPLPPADVQPTDPLATPPPPSALAQPAVVQPIAVAEPSTVAFALPVEGPTVVVPATQASRTRSSINPNATSGSSLPSPQTLVFGQGEGRQPAPEYPAQAMRLRQEGNVGVRLTVNADGRVVDATVAAPSAWPSLNDAAERCVRHRWRFSRGSLRVYEVSIRFALAK
jgi:TonB family protein